MAERFLRLRWPTTCQRCSGELAAKTEAWWNSDAKAATCAGCHENPESAPDELTSVEAEASTSHEMHNDDHSSTANSAVGDDHDAALPPAPPDIEAGVAGASAQRSFDKKVERIRRQNDKARAADEQRRAELVRRRPVLGRVAAVLTPRPTAAPITQSTKAWAQGAAGERRVAEALDGVEGVITLHDRKVPGSKANIDHLAITASGIYVIDAKNYKGKLETPDVGGLFRTDRRLYIGGRDRTKLVIAMEWQLECVRKALGGDESIPLHGVICSVASEWSLLAIRPPKVRGVIIAWPKALRKIVSQPGPLEQEAIERVAAQLSAALPPA